MTLGKDQDARPSGRSGTKPLEARIIVAVTFPLFLCAALVMRLVPLGPGERADRGPRSVFAEAQTAAGTCAAFAFMG